jgi:hypothetical protein
MARTSIEPWVHALVAGAVTGLLAEVLVMRLNPEVTQSMGDVLVAVPLWATWGLVGGGLPLLALLALARRLRRGSGGWPAPELTAFVYLIAAVMSWVNADLHGGLLPEAGHRILRQDVVAWLLAGTLALVGGAVVRRAGSRTLYRVVFAILTLALPVLRLVWQPTPQRMPVEVVARPLGVPQRPLLVVGIEGLDSKVLLTHAGGGRYAAFDRIQSLGSWGPLHPQRPYLRRALWTSAATGTYPGRHGVKSHWGWRLGWFGDEPLRLLPWTPQGSRLILPWGVAKRVVPPPAAVPPLWERLRASGVPTTAVGWPGIWGPSVTMHEPRTEEMAGGDADSSSTILVPLSRSLAAFPDERELVWRSIERDRAVLRTALDAISSGSRNLWLQLEALSVTRRRLEPVLARHTREREVLDLTIALLDEQLAQLLDAVASDTLIALVSPYGLAPPNPWERLRRTIGIGSDWRTSAEDCPDGAVLLIGDGVPQGQRFAGAQMADLAPTLCYLLELPVAQYMEGRVVVEALDEEFLANHPLRVVD